VRGEGQFGSSVLGVVTGDTETHVGVRACRIAGSDMVVVNEGVDLRPHCGQR
jgi:hypothetical protein